MQEFTGKALKSVAWLGIKNNVVAAASEELLELIGYQRDEVIGRQIHGLLNENLRMNYKINFLRQLESEKSYFLFTKALKFREVCITFFYADEENAYLIFREIPNSRLEQSNAYLCQLIEDNAFGIALFNAEDFTVLSASEEFYEIMKKHTSYTDVLGKKIHELSLPGITDIDIDWHSILEKGITYKSRKLQLSNINTAQMEYYEVVITPIKVEKKIKYISLILNSITEMVNCKNKSVEQTSIIMQQKEQLEAFLDNMSDALFIIDKNNSFVLYNKAAKEYFGIEMNSVEDIHESAEFYEYDGTGIPTEELPAAYMQKGVKVLDRCLIMKINNRELYLSISATPVLDSEGRYEVGILSCRDITEYTKKEEDIKKHQNALLMAEKREKENLERVIAMKDDFLSLISHEFKTPLTVINSALQVMELMFKKELSGKIKGYMDKIKQNTYRQLRLVNNLLDITKANASQIRQHRENLDIIFITWSIVESVKVYAQQKQIDICFHTELKKKIISLDEEKYERMLLNLLSNAIKFTPNGKRITVSVFEKADAVAVEVQDEGIGIPKEKYDMIFERFGQVENTYTRQAEGTGIGLFLVKLLAEAAGGAIYLESEVGSGSTFTLEFPDETNPEEVQAEGVKEHEDSRLIQSIAIEFSDIYF